MFNLNQTCEMFKKNCRPFGDQAWILNKTVLNYVQFKKHADINQ